MLSRTADNLFWLFRYTERADFVARILDATMRLAALPTSYNKERNEWEGALAAAGSIDLFHQHYDVINEETVRDFLAFSPHNPASIRSSFEYARTNARAVR
ncbi:MAG TPA: alpha-E domain-containing protein, partial [Saliniramus sp.]|nr:alpha-E domain-containing protein [Saliniramus sp.]